MNKQIEALTEIHDSPSTTMEIPMPTKITGYMAFYRNVGCPKWNDVYQMPDKSFNPILPHNAFENREDAIKAAMQISYSKPVSIKIVAMEFEV
jgi:hypothetical protein